MRKQEKLICPKCNKEYLKDVSEIKRNIRLNRISYCSLSCAADINKIPPESKRFDHLAKYNKSRIDEFTPFRFYLKVINNTDRLSCSLSLNDIKELWIKQNGKCVYTNISLILRKHQFGKVVNPHPFYMYASIDRIDSSKGYHKDNVEFVSLAINLMKNKFSKQEVIDFLNLIK